MSNYKLYKDLDYLKQIRRHKAVYSTLLIIQCEVGHLYSDLIAWGRYPVYYEHAKAVRAELL